MATFSELLRGHIERAGISDVELARAVGVRRQTIFRWKEGVVERPRNRDDVLLCTKKLRLSETERDELLMAAGFAPESLQATGQNSSEPAAMVHKVVTERITLEEPASSPTAAPASTPAATLRSTSVVPVAVWAIVGALFLAVIALAMGWIRPGAPPQAAPAMPSTPAINAAPDQTLVLVSEFANYAPDSGFNVAGRIREALEAEIEAAQLSDVEVVVWPQEIHTGDLVADILLDSGASVMIWGEYDSGRVRVNISTPDELRKWERLLPSPEELSLTINENVPNQVRALAILSLGRLYRAEGEIENARAAFRRALDAKILDSVDDPEFASTMHFYLATVLEQGPNPDRPEAIALYTQVIDAQPRWVNARYNRGTAYLDRFYTLDGTPADLDAAIDDLSWVISRRRDFADAYLNRGIAYYEREEIGDSARAVDHLSRAIALDPDNARYYFNRGLAYIQAGEDGRWEPDFLRSLEIDPAYASSHNGLCWGYAITNRPELALPHCDQAIELGQEGLVRDGRGIANALAGNVDEALADLNAYLDWVHTLPAGYFERYRGPVVEQWILALESGANPFDDETLASLR